MSVERMTLPKGVVAFRAVAADDRGGSAPEPRCVPLAPLALKEIQRRAFERGRACEQKDVAARLGGLLASLAEAIHALDAQRRKDREELARFGVDLAMAAAARLVGSSISAREHDVRALVEALLDEALPGLGAGDLEVAVHPDDEEALAGIEGAGGPVGAKGRIHVVADPAIPRAACRVRAGGAEVLADPRLRLQAMAERLRAQAEEEARGA